MCFINQASLGKFLRKNLAKKQHCLYTLMASSFLNNALTLPQGSQKSEFTLLLKSDFLFYRHIYWSNNFFKKKKSCHDYTVKAKLASYTREKVLCKYKDPSSNLHHPCKKLNAVIHLVTPSRGVSLGWVGV